MKMTSYLDDIRSRLISSNVVMRYDYAWKLKEFTKCNNRLTGIGCRMLYLHSIYKQKEYQHINETNINAPIWQASVYGNGYIEFEEQIHQAIQLMGYNLKNLSQENSIESKYTVDIVFIYIAPPADAKIESQFSIIQEIVAFHQEKNPTDKNSWPMFCVLLGDSVLLKAPSNDEEERLRGLSGFSLSQTMVSMEEEIGYNVIADFVVEFQPESYMSTQQNSKKDGTLGNLMDQFHCPQVNLMHHTERWMLWVPKDTPLNLEHHLTEPSEEETHYWLNYEKGKMCDFCHELADIGRNLSCCSRCRNVYYCSRECQKSDWKMHKQVCGKTNIMEIDTS